MSKVLIVYYSVNGAVREMAKYIARGIEMVDGMESVLRTVPTVTTNFTGTAPAIPSAGAPYVSLADLEECAGLALGSPTHFGNMASSLKHFIDSTTSLWLNGTLVNKPASVFTSTASLHGGQESTLLSMMLPLLHLGCTIVGLPPTEIDLRNTTTGGTPYGVTHHAGINDNNNLSPEETRLCIAQGKRLASIAKTMAGHHPNN